MQLSTIVVAAVSVVMIAGIAATVLLYLRTRKKGDALLGADRHSAFEGRPDGFEVGGEVRQFQPQLPPEVEIDRLRLQVWSSRRRRVRLMGRVYLLGGVASLIAGYFTGYFGFELVSAIAIPLGVFFTFTGTEPHIKSSLAGQSVISAMRVLQEALKANGDEGHAVFIPEDKSQADVSMFIPQSDLPDSAVQGASARGHLYTPLGHDLFRAYLREAGGKTESSIAPLLEQLRAIMTSGLELVDDLEFRMSGSELSIHIRNVTFAEIGRHPDLVSDVYARAGCPVSNSIAEWVSYGTRSKVRWVAAAIDSTRRTADIKLSLIPEGQ